MPVGVLSIILFLSGASGLIFQTLWLRRAGLVFGNAIWSAALILSSFMAGLALGGAIAARLRLRAQPLRVYAGLELLVALAGCALVAGLPLVGTAFRPVFQALWAHPASLDVLRFAASFALLVVPTTAMGLTLPVLLGDPMLRRIDFHRVTALLYGANTVGAVCGALAGEGWLVAHLGLSGTGAVAGTLNLLAAAAAWVLAATTAVDKTPGAAAAVAAEPPRTKPSFPWRWLVVSFSTGAIFLALEVIWFRFLRLYVASSPLAFAAMLAVVLAGIGAGSLVSAWGRRSWFRTPAGLAPLLLLAGLLVAVTYAGFPVPAPRGPVAARYVSGWLEIGGLAMALMFPVSFVSGMAFPMLVSAVDARIGGRTPGAGLVTLANTLGAATGALVAGFVLLPVLGFQSSLLLGAAAYIIVSLVASERRHWSLRTLRGSVTLALATASLVMFGLFPYHRAEQHFANARRPYEADGSTLHARIEGSAGTFQLLECDYLGAPYYYRLVTDGFSMSGTHPQSQRYMRLFAYLPLALNPPAHNALLICYGVGVTADALTRAPQLAHIDIVDVAREVFTLSSEYHEPAHRNPLQDPRVTAIVQDGRFSLQTNATRYDIITGEPPPLKMAGTVNLYTTEFFTAMHDRLNEGGVASFWLPIYQLTVPEVKAILAAFHRAFPNASVWAGSDQEWIMVGTRGTPRPLTTRDVGRLWENPETRADLGRIGVESPAQLAGWFVMDAAEIDRVTATTPPLTDEFPKRLSDAPPDPIAIQQFAAGYMDGALAFQRFRASEFGRTIWPAAWRDDAEVAFAVRETRYNAATSGANWLAELDLYLRHTKLRTPVLDVLHTDDWRIPIAEARARAPLLPPPSAQADRVAAALARRDVSAAIALLEAHAEHPSNPNDSPLLVYLYCLAGTVPRAEIFARDHQAQFPADSFTAWLWDKLRREYGFRPPM